MKSLFITTDDRTKQLDWLENELTLVPSVKTKLPNPKNDEGETYEHIDFGDSAFSEILAKHQDLFKQASDLGLYNGDTKAFICPNNLQLTFGQIVGLAGDYFAIPNKPISVSIDDDRVRDFTRKNFAHQKEMNQRFINAYKSLIYDEIDAPRQVKAILRSVGKRLSEDVVKQVNTGGIYTFGEAGHDKVMKRTLEDAENTQHRPHSFWHLKAWIKNLLYPPIVNNRYTELLSTNYDHFGNYAKRAYKTGHALAITAAQLAARTIAPALKFRYLMEAFMLEAFACHYSTDIFSSGHMRVPRKELPEYTNLQHGYSEISPSKIIVNTVSGMSSLGHLLVHELHDEDGKQGLWVNNQISSGLLNQSIDIIYTPEDIRVLLTHYMELFPNAIVFPKLLESDWRNNPNLKTELCSLFDGARANSEIMIPVNLYAGHWTLLYVKYDNISLNQSSLHYFHGLEGGIPQELNDLFASIFAIQIQRIDSVVIQKQHSAAWIIEVARAVMNEWLIPMTDAAVIHASQKHLIFLNKASDVSAVQQGAWKAYGDGEFVEEKSSANRTMVLRMVAEGINDILDAYTQGANHKETHFYRKYWPKVEDPALGRNHYAMFRVKNGKVEKRKDASDITSKEYIDNWQAKDALAERNIDPLKEGLKYIFHH